MKTTFLNGDAEHKQKGLAHLKSRAEDFKVYMKNDEGSEDLGPFNEYGLSIDYVAPETFGDQDEGYFRYQLSYGGPSEEIRFYYSPGGKEPYRIEFVYLDWSTGVGFDVTNEDWAEWLWEYFHEIGCVEAEEEKATSPA